MVSMFHKSDRSKCYGTHYTVHTAQYTQHSTHYTVHTAQYTQRSTHYTVHTAQYTLRNTHYTAHTNAITYRSQRSVSFVLQKHVLCVHCIPSAVHSKQYTLHYTERLQYFVYSKLYK